ncbi:GyrI-like domain-containing protein [Flavobacterium enshiense]|uniref:GyrI-like domain-containing protein n=1 Tax=Flavobacterium enshiense TaxID=1341165 RepID=UPI00345CA091
MQPRIEITPERKLIGKQITLSISDNKTGELWRSFMLRRNEIKNTVGSNLYSLQRYDDLYFSHFNPNTTFEKWAAVEVSDFKTIPVDMQTLILNKGTYAVFNYKGSSNDNSIFQYIFATWLPDSGYEVDNRLHFEILGPNYKNNDATSEEEIWIPIKTKTI